MDLFKDPFYGCRHEPSKALLHLLCRTLQAASSYQPDPSPHLSPNSTQTPSLAPPPPFPSLSKYTWLPKSLHPHCPQPELAWPTEGPAEDWWEQRMGQERPHLDSWPEAPSPKPAITPSETNINLGQG